MKERLQKRIARAGIASRRKAEQIILGGRVTVNGVIVSQLGTVVDDQDQVAVDGQLLTDETFEYYVLNKPSGVICSTDDEKKRHIVTDLIHTDKRIFPVGRLDYNTTGVLLLTNDGAFTNRLIHPRYGIKKKYIVRLDQPLTADQLQRIRMGMRLTDGTRFAPAGVQERLRQKQNEDNLFAYTLVLHEGKNREIRRMMQELGREVLSLHRQAFGCVTDIGLKPGSYRQLTAREIKELEALSQHGNSRD